MARRVGLYEFLLLLFYFFSYSSFSHSPLILFLCINLVRFRRATWETKGGGQAYLREKIMVLYMEGYVISFLVVWFYFYVLDALKVVDISLIYIITSFNLVKFFVHLSLLKMLARD